MSEQVGRTRRWSLGHADAVVAAFLSATAFGVLVADGLLSRSALPACISVVASFALLAWRRRWPVAVAAVAGMLISVPELTQVGMLVNNSVVLSIPEVVQGFLYAYALGAYCPWKRSLLGLVPLIAGITVATGTFNPLVEMLTVGPWLGGLAVASRRRVAGLLESRAHELEAEREVFAVQSVRYERARIARELHDIVAHSVSLIVVQANAGEHLAHRDPSRAAEAFESIGEAARQADVEIDRLVNLLDTAGPASPSAGLRIVEDLVRRVQTSGLSVSCHFSGDSDDASEPVAEAAYRTVQEAITNAIKHAPGAPIDITVQGRYDAIEIEVVNLPAAIPVSSLAAAGGGHGLMGMHERIAGCGGTFEAGPTADGGWRVAACLPRHQQPNQDLSAPRTAPVPS